MATHGISTGAAKGVLLRILLSAVVLPLFVCTATAFPGGIVGRTLAPSCGACHGPAGANTLVTMSSSSGTYTTSPGGTLNLSLTVVHQAKAAAGMNAAVFDIGGLNAGILSVDNNSGLRISLGEVTHSAPKLLVNDTALFPFTWTAPMAPGTYLLRASGNAVDNTGGSDNDEFNYVQGGPIYLNVTGQVASPTLIAPAGGAVNVPTTATLSWTAVSGAIAFEYQLSTSTTFTVIATGGTVSTALVTVASLQNGTTYYWRVRSLSALSTSAYVSSGFTTVSGPPTSLAMPTIYSPVSGSTGVPTTATLVWSTVPNALQYDYQVSTRSNYSILTTSGTIGETTATVSGLSYNTVYYWRVRSRYGTLVSGYRAATVTTVAGQPPAAVLPPMHAINIPSTAATISWSAIDDAAGYSYQVATQSTFSSPIISLNTTSTTASLPVLQKNRQYFWRVRAYGTAMGTTPYTTANFVTEVPVTATRLRIDNVAETTPKSFAPFTVIVRTDAAGKTANTTKATLLAFTENDPLLSVAGVTTVTLDMGQHVTTLSLVLRSATTSTVTAPLTTATTGGELTATSQTITVEPLPELARVVLTAPVSNATAIPVTTPTVFAWSTVEGATDYTVQLSTRSDFSTIDYSLPYGAADPFATTATTSLQLTGPAQYWWRVQASNIATTGAWSEQWNFLAGARFLAPVLLAPSNGVMVGSQLPSLSWRPVGEPSMYRVQVSTSALFSTLHTDTTMSALQTSVSVVPASGYYWRVRAVDGGEQSEWSPAWNFQTQPVLVVYPNGGEWLLARSTTTIVWSSAGAQIEQVRIELSADGTTWENITASTTNTGSYVWNTPDITTTQALVRITDVTNATTGAASDGAFSIAPPAPLNLTVLLQGPYTSSGMMSAALNEGGLLPLTDPYTGAVSVEEIPPEVTDWVQLEFRPAAVPNAAGEVQTVFLRRDGRIVAPDGSTAEVVDISRIPPGEYYVVVRHRNHLPVMSAAPLAVSLTTALPFDLSRDTTRVYSSFAPAVQATADEWYTMIAGDLTGDGIVAAFDRVRVRNAAGRTGYVIDDITLDGIVNAADRVRVLGNRFAVSQVP